MDTIGATIITMIILAVPISAATRFVAAAVSPRVRLSIARHPFAHLIWLAAAILVIVLPIVLPALR